MWAAEINSSGATEPDIRGLSGRDLRIGAQVDLGTGWIMASAERRPNKRPRTAYLHYSLDPVVREAAKAAHPDANVATLAKVLGAQWRALSDEAKAPYLQKYDTERKRLQEQLGEESSARG